MSENRQLSAIMFTDMQGYTSIMQHDEQKAILLRERHRQIFETSTKKHKGKIVQYFGDGTLSVFKSTVEAINCAIEMQLAFREEPKIPLRIGIHVGDIVYSKEDIIGDAVNVTSRIESIAEPGSILISDKVHDQIRNHKHIEAKFLDVFDLKNVDEVVPIFAIANQGIVIPNPKVIKQRLRGNAELPAKPIMKDKKYVFLAIFILSLFLIFAYLNFTSKGKLSSNNSIAVLPFDNLSTDEDSEIFTDGITEDILTNLSKLKDLHVISRTSVMQFKNSNKTIPEIAEILGVAYILEGSIRKYGDEIRVTAQLINAENDEHIWASNYDKTLTDIFAIQTEVSQEIVSALKLNISFDEQQSLAAISTQNIKAYKLFLLGRKEADKRNKESIAKSIDLYKQAIALDTKYAEAYAEIANSIYLETYYSRRNPKEASLLANEYLDQAEGINDKVSRIYSVRGLIYNIEGKHDKAIVAFNKAISLSPNDLTARHQYSTFFYYSRQYKKQLEQAEIAYKLDPLSFVIANSYATALAFNHKYHEAELILNKVEKLGDQNNAFVINRSYFRLYLDQKKYMQAIPHLKQMVEEENVFNRFIGFCYAKIGDTINAQKTIDLIHKNARPREKSHQLAVVYAGLEITDSVLFYLDTIRNKQSKSFGRESTEFFNYLNDDVRYQELLKAHGITPSKK